MPETADQYRQRMFSHLQSADPLKLQAAAPAKLAKLLKAVSPAMAKKRPAPGKWSIAEIVAHLADTELVGGYRIRAILGAPGSRIIGFDQDQWVTALHYEKRNLRKSFEQYRALREANLALLKILTPEQWKHHGMCTTSEVQKPWKRSPACSRDTTSIISSRLSALWPARKSKLHKLVDRSMLGLALPWNS